MLNEGWDAKQRDPHSGIRLLEANYSASRCWRAFADGLTIRDRRDGLLDGGYADVYGIPFSVISRSKGAR